MTLQLDEETLEALGYGSTDVDLDAERVERLYREAQRRRGYQRNAPRLANCLRCGTAIAQVARKPRLWCSRRCMHAARYVRRSPNARRAQQQTQPTKGRTMTPDRYDYHPCPTCGVLAPVDRPHPATFCARERPDDELDDGLSTGPEPVTVDDPALWGGGT